MDPIAERHAFAKDLAVRAAELAADMRKDLGAATAKSAIDFCTEADLAVERLVRAEIAGAFGDAVIGEEYGGEPAERVWVVDPIDGTAGYIHGTGRWCVSIAFVEKGEIEIGVLAAPAERRFFEARRGGGARLNGAPMEVSRLRHGAAPVVEVGWSERRSLDGYLELLRRLTASRIEFRRHGSGALGLADVAAGTLDGYLELHINAWDALAGILLVREAGGYTNDFLAGDGLTHGNVLIAVTPEIQAAALQALDGLG